MARRWRLSLTVIASSFAAGGCAATGGSPPVTGIGAPPRAPTEAAGIVTSLDTTWYVSARARKDGRTLRALGDSLEYGYVVTRFRDRANQDAAGRYLEQVDAARVDSTRLAASDFLARIRAADSSAAARGEGSVVYVHGFAVSFGRAIAQGAEIAHRGSYRGPMIVFAWPAHRSLATWPSPEAVVSRAYREDSASAASSNDAFRDALALIRDAVRPEALTVVGHSLGAQLTAEALAKPSALHEALQAGPLKAVVLYAPDVPVERFRDTLAAPLEDIAARRIVYASAGDWLLGISEIVNHARRAGRTRSARSLVAEDVEVIDATRGLRADGAIRKLVEPKHSMRWSSSALYDFFSVVRGVPSACRTLDGVAALQPDGTWQLTPSPIPAGIPPAVESCVSHIDALAAGSRSGPRVPELTRP